jgi:hypothetical protein
MRALHHPEQRRPRSAINPLCAQPPVFGQATHRPRLGSVQRLLLVGAGVDQRGQFVEGEDDVGSELVLDPDRHLRGETVGGAVQMRDEGDAVVVDPGQALLSFGDEVIGLNPAGVFHEHLAEARAQRHDLEPAAVGERRPGPVHERPEAARLGDDVRPGLQVQVVGVGQHRLGAQLTHGLGQHGFHGGLGADRDERRGVDVAVRGVNDPAATPGPRQFGIDGEKRHVGHLTNSR